MLIICNYVVVILEINECENGTHTCMVNATCSDTKLSYSCKCKPGFFGDGHSCSGII